MIVPSPPITDENRYATLILNTVLGGGMSSRLFQTIREERGMAYSIYSDLAPYSDTGSLCVYAGSAAAGSSVITNVPGGGGVGLVLAPRGRTASPGYRA